jgi:dimethylargininase
MLTAITRKISPSIGNCELEFQPRVPIDFERASEQHRQYEACLERLGVRVISLPAEPEFPDATFVEDPVVVLNHIAVIARMGAESRRREAESLAAALAPFREVVRLREPAMLEGGDVLQVGGTLYVGLSRRTNADGIRQLSEILKGSMYHVVPVEVDGCLHLKTACCALTDRTVLANRAWFDAAALEGVHIVDVPKEEPRAANVLRVGQTLVVPASCPGTIRMLEESAFRVVSFDNSELAKAEAGLTCTSVIFDAE